MPSDLRSSRRALLGLLVVGGAGALAGCGSASPPSPPTGVDGLTVPTPSPDPADFVAEVDNPWLPLPRGTTLRYRIRDGAGAVRGVRLVEVLDQPGEVAGVATTVLAVSDRLGRGPGVRVVDVATDHVAQDRGGHVWWLARAGRWAAGVDGVRAGLVVPAEPRFGDGWRRALLPGVVEELARVVEVDGPSGADTVVIEVSDPLTGEVRRLTHQRGTGVVVDRQVAPGSVSGSVPGPDLLVLDD